MDNARTVSIKSVGFQSQSCKLLELVDRSDPFGHVAGRIQRRKLPYIQTETLWRHGLNIYILYKYIISVFYGFQEALASQLRCVRGVSETVARSLAKKHSNMKSFISAMMDAEDPVLLS